MLVSVDAMVTVSLEVLAVIVTLEPAANVSVSVTESAAIVSEPTTTLLKAF